MWQFCDYKRLIIILVLNQDISLIDLQHDFSYLPVSEREQLFLFFVRQKDSQKQDVYKRLF